MNFTIEQDERGTIFRPKEARLDSLVAPELKAEFLILAQPDVSKLIVDLSDVEYIDSTGLSALLLARRQMVNHEGDVRLVGVRPEVQSLLELTQLDRVFPSYDTIDEALTAPQLSMVAVTPDGAPASAKFQAASLAFGAAAISEFFMDGEGDVEEDDYDDEDDDFADDETYDDDYDDEEEEEAEDDAYDDKEEAEVEAEDDDEEAYDEDEVVVDEDLLTDTLEDDLDDEEDDEDF
jgi:anti-anti-sigma factor